MEKKIGTNNFELTGNISSIGGVKLKSNGKEFMYFDVAQNSKDSKDASYFPVYLDGKMLEEFREKELKVGDRIALIGKMESYLKNGKTTLQVRPFEIYKVEYEKKQEVTKSNNQENSFEVGI